MFVLFSTAILNFLLTFYSSYPNSAMGERALEMTLFTLKAMANGGMHDHVGQVHMLQKWLREVWMIWNILNLHSSDTSSGSNFF